MTSMGIGRHSSGAGSLDLNTSSAVDDYDADDGEKSGMGTGNTTTNTNCNNTKKRFWNPKNWFKRKTKCTSSSDDTSQTNFYAVINTDLAVPEPINIQNQSNDYRIQNKKENVHIHRSSGLSVSHESIFHSPHSDQGSDMELDAVQSTPSLTIRINNPLPINLRLQTELNEKLRLRRGQGDFSEDDEGLPHSPSCNSPTTTTEALTEKTANNKDLQNKSHSTYSDGSLLTVDSYDDMEEDSFGAHSRDSSKLSLLQDSKDTGGEFELDGTISVPLNHSAAHHKVAIRPKRRAPHQRKQHPHPPIASDQNEDSLKKKFTKKMVLPILKKDALLNANNNNNNNNRSLLLVNAHLSNSLVDIHNHNNANSNNNINNNKLDTQKLNRSQSSASSTSTCSTANDSGTSSFFERILFPRRSAKKRKLNITTSTLDQKSDPTEPIKEEDREPIIVEEQSEPEPIHVEESIEEKLVNPVQIDRLDEDVQAVVVPDLVQNDEQEDQQICEATNFNYLLGPLPEQQLSSEIDQIDSFSIEEPSIVPIIVNNSETYTSVITVTNTDSLLLSNTVLTKAASMDCVKILTTDNAQNVDELVQSTFRQKIPIRPSSNIESRLQMSNHNGLVPKRYSTNLPPLPIDDKTRKFSTEDIEIVDKTVTEEKQPLKMRSYSLGSLKSDAVPQVITRNSCNGVILRVKKPIPTQNGNSEESELMKVFARRSLKLRDSESAEETEEKDENEEVNSNPQMEEDQRTSSASSRPVSIVCSIQNLFKPPPPPQSAFKPAIIQQPSSPPHFKSNNNTSGIKEKCQNFECDNNVITVGPKLVVSSPPPVKKKENPPPIENHPIPISQESCVVMEKSTVVNTAKNFRQRQAEWEKRAQEAQKKNSLCTIVNATNNKND